MIPDDDNLGMHQGASSELFGYAKRMRHEPTEAEAILWEALSNKKLGYKFRRQHPLGRYIVDFYCHRKRLAIEVDGGYHKDEAQRQYDERRTEHIIASGVRELRFTNEEVINCLQQVLETIKVELEK